MWSATRRDCRVKASAGPPRSPALLRAGIASTRGQADVALKRLAEAQQLFEESALAGQLAATRLIRGTLVGGDAGAELLAKAHAFFETEGVVSPERFTAFFVPGFASIICRD